jgi:uroporphyrin-III C-methyltransferase/precorrin-2 dehydrogenase/sirohydrochlorin ferrochelatase
VWLVGAGPGDPELLTRKAARCLRAADLVLYDALVSRETLQLAPRAQRFCVGKRVGQRGVRQEKIHDLMIRAARRGKKVVRLKGGDPFVLGRGGEEALALRRAGIPFEVVPGVTSAVAAPALAGIPLTHRGRASGFAVLSGHDGLACATCPPAVETITPHSLTLVVLMGIRSRASLVRGLLRRGWHPATPAALVLGASTSGAHTWIGRLEELGWTPLPPGLEDEPGTIVVGDVVGLAPTPGALASATPGMSEEGLPADRPRLSELG